MSVTVASRREFLLAATAGAALAAWPLRAQERPRFADMHAHMNFPRGAANHLRPRHAFIGPEYIFR